MAETGSSLRGLFLEYPEEAYGMVCPRCTRLGDVEFSFQSCQVSQALSLKISMYLLKQIIFSQTVLCLHSYFSLHLNFQNILSITLNSLKSINHKLCLDSSKTTGFLIFTFFWNLIGKAFAQKEGQMEFLER